MLNQSVREKISEEMATAAHEVFEVAGELEDTADGTQWIELVAVLYLCLSDLVENGGTAVPLTLPQAKKLADAHVRVMKAWTWLQRELERDKGPHRSDGFIRWCVDLQTFGAAEGELWNLIPTIGQIKTLLPAWAWPDHPDNTRRHVRR